ncbi:helicase with zinc finger domain 2 isoform X1 [Rhincodon typus]|uniref:helicase with zinc finger domain 2 isoform X1 n=1 Tax=Rhincodon typus TaxID=259920 RepID=UPI00202E7FC0|nr:helicase with zinc finger domain 2 isoform X1 [Rhincodon typus]
MKGGEDLFKVLDLQLLCSQCFEKTNESTIVLKNVNHKCQHLQLVARKQQDRNGSWRLIRRRPAFINPVRYQVCSFYREGSGCRRMQNRCTFAWSEEEACVWNYERNNQIERNKLKKLVAERTNNGIPCSGTANKQQTVEEEIVNEFEGQFVELCAICFYSVPQQIVYQNIHGFCTFTSQHGWSPLLVHILDDNNGMKQCYEIRPVTSPNNLQCCKNVLQGLLCYGFNNCNFAHSEVELMVWKSEVERGLKRSTLLQLSQQQNWNGQPGAERVAESNVHFYCRVCLVTFSSQDGFENHCTSIEHAQMVLKDTTVVWNYRKPPLKAKKYQLCSRIDICEFGENCIHAHSHEELEEWLMRSEVAQKRKRSAKHQGLLPYQDRIMEEYRNCRNEILIMSEKVDDVAISCDCALKITHYQRRSKLKWNFHIESQKPLLFVALLKRAPGAVFSLEGKDLPKKCSIAEGIKFRSSETSYHIGVSFEAVNLGIYDQWVIFDFGSRPVLVRKIYISEMNAFRPPENPNNDVQFVDLERWHSGNRRIVPCMERTENELLVLQEYKPPALSLEYKVKDMANIPITRVNYRERMHNFLYQEEQAEEDVVSRLSLTATVFITDMLEDVFEGLMIAHDGELFAIFPPPTALTDSNEGFLFKRAVNTVLLAPSPSSHNVVYEAAIICEATAENRIALKLSPRCHTELAFHKGSHHNVEIQFQLDRLPFCFRHQAVDKLPNEQIIFPDIVNCSIPQFTDPILTGNQKQRAAVAFIAGKTSGGKSAPPLLIYGPFGTGKTFTLATAALEIVKKPNTRLLLCTDTNSAADLYVKDYFHFQVDAGNLQGRPLRMKYVKQNPIHTDPITKQYCLILNNSFVLPDRSTLESYRIVITTCMEAKLFSELKLPVGFFTHILIDEAAQMLECDALIPLALASNETRIVLAGDHMQMTPKLFSIKSSEMADYTLLNRLFQFYQKEKHDKAAKSRIIFRENYRSVKEIIHFVSTHFYPLKADTIQASGNILPHPQFYPLIFCHVPGISSFNSSKLSWYNETEILQVVENVESVLKNWPVEWGQLDQSSVCVVSSEGFQVQCMRHKLRQCGYSLVTVENVFNIQGKQFRVMIISTVHTCESSISSKSASLEFFNQSRVLNTAMTRAQSLVIVVGDAMALCSVGKCSKIWKKYIQESIDNRSIYPEDLTMGQIKQAVIDTEKWACKEEDESDNDSCYSEKDVDPILQELLDESKNVTLTVTEEGLMDIVVADEIEPEENINNQIPTVSTQSLQKKKNVQYTDYPLHLLQRLLSTQPSKYKRCEIIMEKFYKGYAVTLDDPQSVHIKIKGRVNCGQSFPGDQVLVEILDQDSGQVDNTNLSGKVVGVLKAGDLPRIFICTVDEYDLHVMVPVNKCVTKIYTPPVDKKSRNRIPIRKRKKDKIVTTQTIRLTEEIRRNYFFVVELLCWRSCFYFPLGIVTKMLPAAVTMDQGMEILNLEYQVHDSYPKEVFKEVAECSQIRNILDGNRKDCQKYLTFTVDHESSKDLDDAISVRDLGENYEIGIHIADVASFVPKGSFLDGEALKRGVTHYPPGRDPIHMLPPKLSQEVCSLLPGKPRKVISLFVVVQKGTDKVVKANFSLSVIQSDRKLSYDEAECILNCFSRSELRFDTLEDSVATAFHFSRIHRKCRLQDDCYYDQADEDRHPGNRKSQQMIEELMIMMNSFVAEFLTNKMKTMCVTPLRCQGFPAPQEMAKLENKHKNLISLSVHLSHHFGIAPNFQSPPCEKFQILSSLWNSLIKAAEDNDIHKLTDFIATDDIHPNLAPVTMELRKLMLRSFFARSSSTSMSKQGHYSLHLEAYTWATSPIRRYLDIIIQRLLAMTLCREENLPYSKKEIDKLCTDFNKKNRKASNYEKKAQCLYFATQLRSQVVQKLVFAVDVEPLTRYFKVIFPLKNDALSELHDINYRTLQLVDQPAYNERTKSMKLTWRKRIYCLETTRNSILPPTPFDNPHVRTINANTWQQFVQAVRSEKFSEVAALLLENSQGVLSNGKQGHFGKIDVSKCQLSSVSHYVHISLEVKNGDALQLQLSTDIKNGFLVPAVQLLSITPVFEICIEHAENPVICFSEYATRSPQKIYSNAKEYQEIWGPLCAMESASSAVCENEVIVIYDVKISWMREDTNGRKLQGSFCIPKEFCENWHIESALTNCYLCIRCRGLKIKPERNLTRNDEPLHQSFKALHVSENSSELNIDPDSYIWVAHAVTEEFKNDGPKLEREPHIKTIFSVHKTTMDMIPNEIFQEDTMFVVEIIPKLLPDLRKERAIQNLPYSSRLAQNIALGQPIPLRNNPESPLNVLNRTNYCIPEYKELNRSQVQAVQKALGSSFALIQGPPGTGKTVVGVHIVFWFHKMNYDYNNQIYPLGEENKDKRCILYCGPSNKSVNVVAEYLLKLQKYLKPLRVYSEQMEMVDFPYPGSQLMISKKSVREGKPKPDLRPITLHYKIRQQSNPFAPRIKAYDEKIQSGTIVTEEEIVQYKKLLNDARKYELKRHDVILCTCATSSSKALQQLSVRQVLVDESAMCTEPELLIPIVAHKQAKQIVLLGDHMQLRPIITNEFCRRLGMETSLFERYVQQTVMLNVQYRMHEEICQFPSQKFYKGKLETDPTLAHRSPSVFCHRGKMHCPIIFGHILGDEISLMVSTEEGNENSRANKLEAEKAVFIVKQLTFAKIIPSEIAVLTPYNAQVLEINKLLNAKGITGVNVCTIIKSQGSEWRYVILSAVRSLPQKEIDKQPSKAWLKKHLGFITDPNQVNVALTRAKEGLCILGNEYLLRCSNPWKDLLVHYRTRNALVNADDITVRK